MHVASGDRFISFKAAGIAGLAVSFSIARGIARGGQTDEPKQMSHQKMSMLCSF